MPTAVGLTKAFVLEILSSKSFHNNNVAEEGSDEFKFIFSVDGSKRIVHTFNFSDA